MVQIEPLEKLASTGLLKQELPSREEIAGLLRTAAVRLEDARKTTNAPESRFDLAYNAAHAFALAALRIHGYRSDKRYIVFSGAAAHPRCRHGNVADSRSLSSGAERNRIRRDRIGRREAPDWSHRCCARPSHSCSCARRISRLLGSIKRQRNVTARVEGRQRHSNRSRAAARDDYPCYVFSGRGRQFSARVGVW
jgi:hypothetical protein